MIDAKIYNNVHMVVEYPVDSGRVLLQNWADRF